MSASDFGAENVVFNYALLRLLQISPDWNKHRRLEMALQSAITPVHAYQIWWTLVHKWWTWDRSFNPSKNNFFGRWYLRG